MDIHKGMLAMTLYHGSDHIIEKPAFGLGKVQNDYGLGFYCTEHVELAKEWACGELKDGFANKYEIDLKGLKVIDLNSADYTIVDWLAVLVANRDVQVTTPIQIEAKKQLLERFLPDFSKADIIRGYRADDSYFSFARAFLGNEISLRQLSLAMRLGQLGEQVVLKSKKAFGRLRYSGNVLAEAKAYYPKRLARDTAARAAFKKEASNPDLDGIFMRDILREHMRRDDARLR